MVDKEELRIELARQRLFQSDVARLLHVAPSTLSGWLHERYPGPPDLAPQLERALRMREGSLTRTSATAITAGVRPRLTFADESPGLDRR